MKMRTRPLQGTAEEEGFSVDKTENGQRHLRDSRLNRATRGEREGKVRGEEWREERGQVDQGRSPGTKECRAEMGGRRGTGGREEEGKQSPWATEIYRRGRGEKCWAEPQRAHRNEPCPGFLWDLTV